MDKPIGIKADIPVNTKGMQMNKDMESCKYSEEQTINIVDKKTKELVVSIDFKEKNIILKNGYEVAKNGEKILLTNVEG